MLRYELRGPCESTTSLSIWICHQVVHHWVSTTNAGAKARKRETERWVMRLEFGQLALACSFSCVLPPNSL